MLYCYCMGLKIKRVLYICLFAMLMFSCSNSKPEIVYGFLQLVLYQGVEKPQEQFSFFVLAEDEDGLENLDALYLFYDKEQLRWQINSDDWVSHTQDGQEWIGTRSIAVREGDLPRGVYRAVLVNKGGESAERNFTFDGVVRFPFPKIEISNGNYTVNSQWPVNRLACYDASGNYSSTVTLQSLSGSVSQLRLPSSTITVALWADDESNFCSACTDVVRIN